MGLGYRLGSEGEVEVLGREGRRGEGILRS